MLPDNPQDTKLTNLNRHGRNKFTVTLTELLCQYFTDEDQAASMAEAAVAAGLKHEERKAEQAKEKETVYR